MHSHDNSHHDHAGHDHGIEFKDVNVSFVIAVIANLAFTIVEGTYALITNSASLLADAGHNLSDVLGLLLAWGAAYLALQRTSDLYSYGFRKTTILAALINSVVLIFAAAFIAFESVEKIMQPTAVSEIAIMVVAGIGIFVNFGTTVRSNRQVASSSCRETSLAANRERRPRRSACGPHIGFQVGSR